MAWVTFQMPELNVNVWGTFDKENLFVFVCQHSHVSGLFHTFLQKTFSRHSWIVWFFLIKCNLKSEISVFWVIQIFFSKRYFVSKRLLKQYSFKLKHQNLYFNQIEFAVNSVSGILFIDFGSSFSNLKQ